MPENQTEPTKVACNKLKKEYEKYQRMLEERMDNPLKLIAAAEKLINSAVNLAEDAFQGMLDLINWPDSGSFLDNLLQDLQYLRNCIALAGQTEYLGILDAAIWALEGGGGIEDLPGEFLDSTKGDWQDRATEALDKVANESILGKLQTIENAYEDMLRQSGIYEILGFMDAIVTCMTNICEDAVAFGTEVEEYRETLKIGADDVANPDFANSDKINNVKKQALEDAKTSWQEAKDAVTNITWP